jgi:hypothetical protein
VPVSVSDFQLRFGSRIGDLFCPENISALRTLPFSDALAVSFPYHKYEGFSSALRAAHRGITPAFSFLRIDSFKNNGHFSTLKDFLKFPSACLSQIVSVAVHPSTGSKERAHEHWFCGSAAALWQYQQSCSRVLDFRISVILSSLLGTPSSASTFETVPRSLLNRLAIVVMDAPCRYA